MQFQYSPYIPPLLAASMIAGFVAVYVWQRRATASGAVALVVLALACVIWSLGYALEIGGVDLSTKIFWGKIQYIGIVMVPLAWVLFAQAYSMPTTRMTRRRVAYLSVVPLITLILALTNESHLLIWNEVRVYAVGAFSALDLRHGVWFWVYWLYANILLLVGTLLVFRSVNRTSGLFRRQNLILLIAVLAPWIGNVLYVSGLSPIPHLDLTPFAFTISVAVFTWGIFSFQLVNLAPVARELVVEKMPDGMLVLDMQGTIVDINPAMSKALGRPVSQLVGQKAKDLFSAWPELVERYENTIDAQGEFIIGEGEARTWYELRMSPLVDSRERLIGRVATMRNITRRKQTEEALRQSEENYRRIYENVEDVIYETDNHGHLTSISPSIEKRGGYQPEELIGRSVTEFFVLPEHYAALDTQMLEQGSVNDFEALLRHKNGTTIFVSITAHIIFDANGRGVATEGVLRDITERKLVEERIRQMNAELEHRVSERTRQLEESNAYLTTLIETAFALNVSLDLNAILDSILLQANKLIPAEALNVMFVQGEYAFIMRRVGYQGLEKIERKLLEFRFPITWPLFHQMLVTRKSVHIADTARESNWQRVPGAEWVGSYVGVPLVINDETIGFLNVSHSHPEFFEAKHVVILESLAHHASLAIQNARLLEELKKALEKEQGMREQLVHADKLAALGKMVSVIAHEINNPIQTVKNSLYLLEDQIVSGSPAEEYLKMASEESNRIADLVSRLRGTYASGSKTMERLELSALLHEVHELLAPQFKKRKVDWQQADDSDTYVVCAVRNNLKQVFINLGLNAMEAMETERERTLTVKLKTDPAARRAGVELHNTGPLIAVEALPHIFEPFFTTKKSGTGLGLSISYDIIRQHQGEILIENGAARGVTFTVWLPLAPGEEVGENP